MYYRKNSGLTFYFSLSLLIAVLCGLLVLLRAFSGEYVVQDDARQHVFWMRRFVDPQLFTKDLIADYFQSVAPWGYITFYRTFAAVGVDPLLLAKLLPPVLGVIATVYGFGVSLQLLPIPFTGFLTAVLLNQVLWLHNDLASATPRGFMPVIFLAFLYYLLRRSLWPCLVAIALEGLFYPQYVFVFAGILCLTPWRWRQGTLKPTLDRSDLKFCITGLVVAFLVMLPFALSTSQFGPTITAAEAKLLPQFYEDGRSRFFVSNFWEFWLTSNRSGLIPKFEPLYLFAGVLLPLLLRFPKRFPLAQRVTGSVWVLSQIVIVALFLFFVAHVTLFKLHLPSRYAAYTLRFAAMFALAIALTLALDGGWQWLKRQAHPRPHQRYIVWGASILTAALILLYPLITGFPKADYRYGANPELYKFFAQQPKDIQIASLHKETDYLPTFAQRSIVIGYEYSIPYHLGYANALRQRTEDLMRAQYSLSEAELLRVIDTYDISFWLLDRSAFRPDFLTLNWTNQYPEATAAALKSLQQGKPAIARLADRCSAWQNPEFIVVESQCLIDKISP
jgi:hypothetical protein